MGQRKEDLKKMSDRELSVGAVHSLINSFMLFHDGMTLSHLGRYSRAYTLVQLSIEEAGKALMLEELAFFKKNQHAFTKIENETFDEKLDKVDRLFFKHETKTEGSMKFMIAMIKNMFLDGEREEEEIKRLKIDMDSKELNNMKNSSLYVDLSNGSFKIPYDAVSEKEFSKLQALGHSILHHAKKYVFRSDEIISEMGGNPELLRKLDPYSESRRLNHSVDLNKYHSKAAIDW